MASLRQFIRDMTSLPSGSTVRTSIENPKTVGGGTNQYIGADLRIKQSNERASIVRAIQKTVIKIIETPVIYKMVIRKIEVNLDGKNIAINKR